MRTTKTISIFLGVSMFMFGILKFFNPFKGWYAAQIAGSGLGEISYVMGIAGEIFSGTILLLAFLFRRKISNQLFTIAIVGVSALIVLMMSTGIYVHLQPEVPAAVLPLKIKPPFIPALFLVLALVNGWTTLKSEKAKTQ